MTAPVEKPLSGRGRFAPVDEAIAAIGRGEIIVVVDD